MDILFYMDVLKKAMHNNVVYLYYKKGTLYQVVPIAYNTYLLEKILDVLYIYRT